MCECVFRCLIGMDIRFICTHIHHCLLMKEIPRTLIGHLDDISTKIYSNVLKDEKSITSCLFFVVSYVSANGYDIGAPSQYNHTVLPVYRDPI